MKKGVFKGLDAVILENEFLSCTFLPEYGSKLASFIDQATNYEWLYQAKEPLLKIPNYGADFALYDSSGFDEVFPGIDKGPHPSNLCMVPDHGEVWSLPWEMEVISDNELKFTVDSPVFPYTLVKEVKLDGAKLVFQYKAINHSDDDFAFIWTPHALLNFDHYTKIEVPQHLHEVMSVEHSTIHLGKWGTRHPYPITKSIETNENINLSKIQGPIDGTSDKYYFTSSLKEGWCRTVQPNKNSMLTYTFPVEKVPYLGVWKTQGGYRGDYNFALEPCTGVYDDVYVAEKIKKVSKIPAKGTYTWWFKMEVSDFNQ